MAYTVHNFEQGDVLYAEQLNEMDAQIAANEENINNSVSSDMLAENYSANKTYSIGDYVIYDNELYTCIYKITAPEGWNSAHWRTANLGDGISNLNRHLSDLDNALNDNGLSWNIIPYNYYSGDDYTNAGIHFVKNTDGTVSSSGTATGQARYYWLYEASIEPGSYLLSGLPTGAGTTSFRLQYAIGTPPFDNSDFVIISRDAEITIASGQKISVRSWYYSGYVDTGHVWSVRIGSGYGNVDSRNNPKNFIPVIYANESAVTALESDVTSLETNVAALESGMAPEGSALSGTYEVGSLKTNGSPTDSANRVRSAACVQYQAGTCLSILNGYRIVVYYYTNASDTYSVTNSGWQTGNYVILDTAPYIKLVIGRDPETSDAAVVETFVAAVSVFGSELAEQVGQNTTAIAALESAAPRTLPSYWQSYLDGKKATMIDNVCAVGNHGTVFAFFTDFHWVQTDVNYQGFTWLPQILNYCKREYLVPDIIFGGDIITNNDTRAEALAVLEDYRAALDGLGVKNINGNHETNPYSSGGASEVVLADDIYAILYRGMGMEESVTLEPGMYWIKDNPTQKIRIIALNTWDKKYTFWANDSEQHQWFVDALSDIPSGWTVLVTLHLFFGLSDGAIVESSVGTNVRTLVDAYATKGSGTWNSIAYDFTDAGGTVAGILTGHVHNDYSVMSNAGYPIIGTVCDAMWGSSQSVPRGSAAVGTVNEHAFDIVCLDTAAKTIKCYRIGSGSDRSFSYT